MASRFEINHVVQEVINATVLINGEPTNRILYAVANISVNVSVLSTTGSFLTLYAAETGGGTIPNPTTSETLTGRIEAWVDVMDYDIVVSGPAIETYTEKVRTGPPIDGLAATPSIRTLGTSSTQAAAGNDARFTDQRVPTDGSVTVAKTGTGDNGLARGAFSVTKNAQNFSGASSVITWDTETFDVSSWFDLANDRFVPQVAGIYRVSIAVANLVDIGGSANLAWISFRKNGAAILPFAIVIDMTVGGGVGTTHGGTSGTRLFQMNGTTDYIDLVVNTDTGTVQITNTQAIFEGELVGRT